MRADFVASYFLQAEYPKLHEYQLLSVINVMKEKTRVAYAVRTISLGENREILRVGKYVQVLV